MQQLTFIEVFAGCGGMSYGLIQSGMNPLLLVDNDKDCIATLRNNHHNVNVLQKDVRELHLDEYKGVCDVLVGGVPCVAFSQAGKRKGLDDPRGSLFYDFARLIHECEPKMFVVENVHGLITINQGQTFQHIIKIINTNDEYNIQYKLLNAVDYEVPQKRKRVIIVGVKKELQNEFTYPEPRENKIILRDVLTNCPESVGVKYSIAKQKVLELVPEGGCWINLPEDVKKQYMGKSILSGGGKRGFARRLSLNESCLTLTTSPCQKQTERCHPTETRPLTVREYARIQTFPDEFVFSGSVASQYRQIGNAVPVRLAYFVGMQIKKLFAA
jgi:DNA (cytosine-5)-methyltransferase 1